MGKALISKGGSRALGMYEPLLVCYGKPPVLTNTISVASLKKLGSIRVGNKRHFKR